MAPTFLQLAIQYSSIALLYYDYVLTFGMEAKYIWGSRIRLSTILYIFCRYALPANILYLLAITNKLHSRFVAESTTQRIIGALSVLGRAAVILVWSGRNYAMYSRNRWILALCGVLGMFVWFSTLSTSPACVAREARAARLVNTFPISLSRSHSILSLLAAELLSILMVVFEFASAGLMTIRTAKAWRTTRKSPQKKPFENLLFEQGMLYFVVVIIITTAAVVLNYRAPGGFLQRLLNAFILPLSGLLTARFLLHLRRWEDKNSPDVTRESRSTMQFQGPTRTVLSSIMNDFGGDPTRHHEQDHDNAHDSA
ncbi:hypothetical protein BD779DRAFT_1677618 [Infundibulicybe gibba]|nr:hypothetical protein BD779DRAFT_1677618 [Infundibulicybe gibba]